MFHDSQKLTFFNGWDHCASLPKYILFENRLAICFHMVEWLEAVKRPGKCPFNLTYNKKARQHWKNTRSYKKFNFTSQN